ncbi:hypothetical protein [Halomarina rubra]|uniref:DUF8080 domain-containing protein n=1 Tax=Halomarina rubra TaxID=2071873 RepID=A0ABD6AUQ8_9EURY|nr:hypothetical protein [Halomarina rubra]
MNAEWTTRRCGERTLVEIRLATDRPRQVRVEPTGEATVLPPRTDGVPDAGWDERGYSGVVDGTLGLGFAVSDTPDDPPVRVAWRGPPDDDPTFETHPEVPSVDASLDAVVRDLSDPRPPRDAIPAAEETTRSRRPGDHECDEDDECEATEPDHGTPDVGPPSHDPASSDAGREDDGERRSAGDESVVDDESVVGDEFAALDRRLALAERLASATTLDEAGAAVAEAGGLAGVRALDEALTADRERLRALAERVERLRERAERVDVPTETLVRTGGEEP